MRKIYRQQGIADAEKVKRQRADLRAESLPVSGLIGRAGFVLTLLQKDRPAKCCQCVRIAMLKTAPVIKGQADIPLDCRRLLL